MVAWGICAGVEGPITELLEPYSWHPTVKGGGRYIAGNNFRDSRNRRAWGSGMAAQGVCAGAKGPIMELLEPCTWHPTVKDGG